MEIYPIRQDGDVSKTIYVVKVPVSLDAPHMSRDKRYYKRNNFEAVRMEEYEVRNLYGRKLKSSLGIAEVSILQKEEDEKRHTSLYELVVKVENIGDIPEAEYLTCVYLRLKPGMTVTAGAANDFYEHTSMFMRDEVKYPDMMVKIEHPSSRPIFPDTATTALRLELSVPTAEAKQLLLNEMFRVCVFYSNKTVTWDNVISDQLFSEKMIFFLEGE